MDQMSVSGIVRFDSNAAYLRLEPVRPTETRAPSASNARNVPWPASTTRPDDQIFQAVLAGEVKVHATRQPMNMQTLKVSMNNIQGSLKLKIGTGAGWSDEADDRLIRLLASPKQKRTNSPGRKKAIKDADDVLAIENTKSETSSVDQPMSENVNNKNEPIVSEETLDQNVPENTESMDEAPNVPENNEPMDAASNVPENNEPMDEAPNVPEHNEPMDEAPNVPENNEPMDVDADSSSDSSSSSSSTHKSALRRRVRELESLLNEATQDLWSANDALGLNV